ncbi:MAG: hypothetical protein ABSC34_01155 [Acidimicrobiales bacterium]
MKWASPGVVAALVALLLVTPSDSSQAPVTYSIANAPHEVSPSRSQAARMFVAAYDALVAATFEAAIKENSSNRASQMRGVAEELAAREAFDTAVRTISVPTGARRVATEVVTRDRLIEADLRGLNADSKGITNGDPLNFYLAVDALAKQLGVATKSWPPVTPAGPTAGD